MIRIFVALLLFFISGCNPIDFALPPTTDYETPAYLRWQREQSKLFEPYIGQTSQEIKNKFGQPKFIHYSNSNSPLPQMADEMWIYDSLQIKNASSNWFLFKEKRLFRVLVK